MCEVLRPILVEADEEADEDEENEDDEDEDEEEEDISMRHPDNGAIVTEVVGQDEHDTAPVPAQSSQIDSLDDERGSLDVTEIDARADSQGQLDNHTPTLDGHALCTRSE